MQNLLKFLVKFVVRWPAAAAEAGVRSGCPRAVFAGPLV
jgi:hypothetical protein